jgi:dynein heavy chain, axonemal
MMQSVFLCDDVLPQAIKGGEKMVSFLGREFPLADSCAFVATMDPSCPGRSQLPDNLKTLLRPMALVAPDVTMIAEMLLTACGFQMAKVES